ncbi:MAG: tocopherol cyclase family protein [Spirochaetaceae bacterium]
MLYGIKRLYRPEYFQGAGRRRRYFEGWYYKFVFPERVFAVIPGVSLAAGDPHAFIQIIDAEESESPYHRFPLDSFSASRDRFALTVGANRFDLASVSLDLPELRLDARMESSIRWPSRLLSPGTMGWYSFVPGMECRHGVIVLDGDAHGRRNGATLSPGRFYLEKDWGRSFPHAWVWLQTNSFESPGSCITASIATVPFITGAFTGFLIGVLAQGRLYRFTTYTGATLQEITIGNHVCRFTVTQQDLVLEVEALRRDGVDLRAPVEGEMRGRVNETLHAEVRVTLRKGGDTLLDEIGRHGGLEVVNPDRLGPF